jgi:nitrogen regulatory protein PII
MKKIMSGIIVGLLLFTQTIVYAIDVEIPGITPDLQAPFINEISVSSNELSPTTPVKVVADISDELSGFNKGNITYIKPNNQILSVPFTLNSTIGKYEASITVPEIDVAGEWKVRSIYLQDKKDNSIYLNHLSTQTNGEKIDFTKLNLNVTGVIAPPVSTDKEPPVLHSISVSSQEVSVNEKFEIIAEVTDNESGVSNVIANYKKPSGDSKSITLYPNVTGQFVGSHTIGKYEESGEWILTSVYVYDKNGNSKTITNYIDKENNQKNLDHCKVNVSGTTIDSEAPILHDISVSSQQVKANEKIEVRAKITDNESGVSTVTVTYKKPNGNLQSFNLYKNADGLFVGSVTIGQYEERGNRILASVYLSDAVGNNKKITSYLDTNNNVKDFTHCTVEVTGTTPDWEGPEFTSGQISVQKISPAQAAVKLVIEVEDSLSGIVYSSLTGTYRKPMSGKLLYLNFIKQGNQYTATILIDQYDEIGEWVLENLSISDVVGNRTTPIKIGGNSLSEFNINVMGNKITVTPGTHNHISYEAPEILKDGQTYQLRPVLVSSNANVADIDITNDSKTEYSTTDPKLLTVNSTGLLTVPAGAGSGFVFLEVTHGKIKRQVKIKVNNGTDDSFLQISPLSITLHAGESEQMKVVEINDGVRKDITGSSSGITYTSSNPSLVTVTKDGLIQAASGDIQGTAYIHVKYNDLVAKTSVKVSKPIVKSLSISPLEEDLSLTNNKLQLVLKAFMTDGTTRDVTKAAEGTKYVSSNQAIAQVSEDGLITIPPNASSGDVVITARNGGVSVQSKVKVSGIPELTEIKVTPNDKGVFRGDVILLSAVGIYSDGSTKDITLGTKGTTYTSSVPSRAKVDENGTVTIPSDATYGPVNITIRNGKVQTTIVLKVEEDLSGVLTDIKASTEKETLKREETTQLKVTGVYGSGEEKDITKGTEGTTYKSLVPSRAKVDENGTVTIPSDATYGSVTITVRNGKVQTTVVLKVEEDPSKVLIDIKASTEKEALKREETTRLKVTGVYGSGEEKDITKGTEGTTYTSSVPSRAKVDENGTVTIPSGATYGPVTITVRNGKVQTTVVLKVEEDPSKVLTEIKASVENQILYPEATAQLKVTGVYKNGHEKNLTSSSEGTTYVSSVPSRAVVDKNGLITVPEKATRGNVTITIRNGGLRTTLVLTVQ